MVNLRYHIVSITAVFLALGIGIAMGSSFLGAAAVDQIKSNVADAQQERDVAREERDALRNQVAQQTDRQQALIEQGSELLFRSDLADAPVLIITVGGVDGESLDHLRTALDSSRATFEGTLTIEDKVIDEGAAEELGEVLTETGGGAALRAAMADAVAADLLDRGLAPDGQPSTEPAPPRTTRRLVDAGFLSYEAGPDGQPDDELLDDSDYRYVVVTGVEPDVGDVDFLLPLIQALTDEGEAPVVVASAATGEDLEENRPLPLAPLREDETISERISTVDDLESLEGVAAVVYALEDLARERRGHYGVADGVDSLLPEP